MTGKFGRYADKGVGRITLTVIGFAILFVIISAVIDIIRQHLFKVTRMNEISERIVYKIDRMIS